MNLFSQLTGPKTGKHADRDTTLTNQRHQSCDSLYTINGNHVSGKEQFQPQGVSGTDLTTGAEYQGTGVTQDDFSGSFINGQYQETFVDNFRFPGQGSAVNYLMYENAHVTINANGTVTANFDKLSISCG
jgi:hypothetical protein